MKRGLVTQNAFKKMSSGHPWLVVTDIIDRTVLPARPSALQLGDHWWLCSPESFLRLRRLGPAQKGWMKTPRFESITNADLFQAYFGDWLLEHFQNTLKKKIAALRLRGDQGRHDDEDLCLRWIFSENDFVPGLIVDVFGPTVVAQINSAPVEVFWFPIRNLLRLAYESVTGSTPTIIELRNSPVRKKEGLDVIEPESAPETQVLRWNGFKWFMTPAGTQKTGAYFDQRENHRRTAELAQSYGLKTAWDLCSYQGGFSLHLLRAGLNVTAVDQSSAALDRARQNVELNSLPLTNFRAERADIFEWLSLAAEQRHSADLIVLDPPSFVKSRNEIKSALRGYKELNALALRCLNPGGLLASCACSHHVTAKAYETVLKEAASATKSKVQLVEVRGPSPDHMAAPDFPEGAYLQAWYLHKL